VVASTAPATYTRMCSVVRFQFEVAGHRWHLYFGPPNRRYSPARQLASMDCGGVLIERDFQLPTPFSGPAPDPYSTNPPWVIRTQPWDTTDPAHPRYGMTVGFLYYVGARKNDPLQYAGAFEIRWANTAATAWTVHPH